MKSCEPLAHRRNFPPLQDDTTVRIQPIRNNEEIWKQGTIVYKIISRSYIVETQDGKQYRRDRQFLRTQNATREADATPTEESSTADTSQQSKMSPSTKLQKEIRTRAGRLITKPKRYE